MGSIGNYPKIKSVCRCCLIDADRIKQCFMVTGDNRNISAERLVQLRIITVNQQWPALQRQYFFTRCYYVNILLADTTKNFRCQLLITAANNMPLSANGSNDDPGFTWMFINSSKNFLCRYIFGNQFALIQQINAEQTAIQSQLLQEYFCS